MACMALSFESKAGPGRENEFVACMIMACIVMAYVVVACIAMAYIVMMQTVIELCVEGNTDP